MEWNIDKNTKIVLREAEFDVFDSNGELIKSEIKKVVEVYCNIPSGGKRWEKMCAWFREHGKLKRLTFVCLADRCSLCNARLFIKHNLARLL